MIYECIRKYATEYSLNWLLNKLNILRTAYYNYLKDRNKDCKCKKEKIKDEIMDLYHQSNYVSGYRMIYGFLIGKGYEVSPLTVHKYMNKELKLFSITRRRKPQYIKGCPHKIFKNLLKRDFIAEKINQKWG